MTFTYDFITDPDVSKVRLLITDTDADLAIFSDEELEIFIGLVPDGSILLAAAQALDVIASSETLVLKVISNLGLSTNGPSVATSLREHAKELRRQVDAGEDGEDEWAGFEIAEQVFNGFSAKERLVKQAMRTGL